MATNIIKQLRAAEAKTATIDGVTIVKYSSGDRFTGTIDALIAAGLITAEQLPGQPGMPKVSATYYNGVLCRYRSNRAPRDLGYLNVCRPATGKKITVTVGITAAEEAQRRTALRAEDEAMFAARQAKQAELCRIAISEGDFRAMGSDLVMMVWRLGRTEGRSRIEDFPFELTDDSAETLCNLLRQIQQLFKTAPLQTISKERANLLTARKDSAFQAFLQLQCIPAAGANHA